MPDSALPALLSLTSHELRGPTGVVRGYLRLLEQDALLPERVRRTIAQASDASNRLLDLLEELSELGRFKSGTIRLSPKSVSLRSVLVQAVQAVALPNPDVTLDVLAQEDVRVRADEARLRFVFETLIVTLARAQNGVVTLELKLVQPRKANAAPHVVVAIHSLGRGMVSERPVDLTRGGIGLTLAIADAIVTAHGGRLRERWLAGRWVGFAVRL
ncbi:MAG: histidine kinase dimerization/phospho-acceptor domain-containing protein [Vicinamibacterales bacterium]